ncbi:uncharacterized protein DSM5745_08770 [Aspergillus mulundensis]|uniref:Uncharacterized protein n=1 Tax=Aspergillus mulundensis TaxID=1810919 RepID=A0A3D8R4X0_9EURO|nr:hypothetical protein DSM5745_08770 [Aspergillus mulundensis]RDW69010.1 hypothetical protein DSM5745_08770 [Aspergillus mulundensis]
MPSHKSCTSPSTLCGECKSIYDELVKKAYERFQPEQIFPSPRVHTLVFVKNCRPDLQFQKYFVPLAVRLRTVLGEMTGERPEIDWHKELTKDRNGKEVLRVKVLVNAAKPVDVTTKLMERLFGADELGDKGWKREEFEGDEWQTLQRLVFYRAVHL